VVMGSGIGACLTLSCLLVLRLAERTKAAPRIRLAKRLTDTAIPLALADDLRTGISTLENMIVPKRLALFPGTLSPLAAFGTVCGMVFPILMFPTAILFGLTELLVPELARCNAAGSDIRIQYLVKKSLRVALLFGTVCGGILYLCADALCISLYNSEDAGIYLRWFSLLAVMLYCDIVTDAMIKGLGQQKASVRYNIFTNFMDVILLYLLLPRYGIVGYFISFTVTHVINFLLSLRRLLKITDLDIPFSIPLRALLAAFLTVLLTHLAPSPFMKAGMGIPALLALLFIMGVVRRDDCHWLLQLVNRKDRPQ